MSDTIEPQSTDIPTRLVVLGMAHRDGTVLASEVYEVAEACGLSTEQVRSHLRRMVAAGRFTREGEGRNARFHPTPAGLDELESEVWRTQLAFTQDAAGKGWDRRWRLVAFAVPESRRSDRDSFRDWLVHLGGAAIQNGVYVSPHDWHDEVMVGAHRNGITDHVTLATSDDLEMGGERDPRVIAAMLWPIDELASRYEKFIEAHRDVPDQIEAIRASGRRISDAEYMPGTLSTILAFRECHELDPMLPPELLPRPWPGRDARRLLARSRRSSLPLREGKGPALFSVLDRILDSV